ncbi:hypothetical protein M0R19_01945 [Candidatus Pacearchaeota archaeon]|nr:hypothetical protein [Candidatus Pacearchaeota archaeon]
MKIQEQRRKWYERNKEFLRAFESSLPFLVYRSQRTRCLRLQRELNYEKSILGRYYTKMKEAKEQFKQNQTKQKEEIKKRSVEQGKSS